LVSFSHGKGENYLKQGDQVDTSEQIASKNASVTFPEIMAPELFIENL